MNNLTALRRSPLGVFPGQPAPRLYDRVVEALPTRHYSRRTEEAYIPWIRRFLLFHARAHPRELAEGHVEGVLTQLDRVPGLVCTLLYGSGLRLLKGWQLRVTWIRRDPSGSRWAGGGPHAGLDSLVVV